MEQLVQAMRVVHGTAFALYVKTHAYHWNVEGSDFAQLHSLFGDQYAEIWASIDDIAERIRTLDAYASSSMERFLSLSRIASESGVPGPREMIVNLVLDHEIMIEVLNEAFKVAETVGNQSIMNFLANRLEIHSKHRWMLRSTGKNKS